MQLCCLQPLLDISMLAVRAQQAVGNGNLTGATQLWALLESAISNATDNVVRPAACPSRGLHAQ